MRIHPLPNTSTQADAVILANGEYPTHKVALSILTNSRYIVCCDGAINKLSQTNIIPQAIVGDCDSLSIENKTKYSEIIHQVQEQETNDLTKSVSYCLSINKPNIIILGATGKREDHSIANISLLADYIDKTEDICIISDYGVFNAINRNSTFSSYQGQQISIFSIDTAEITTSGLKYPIEKRIFTNWWQATLNESVSDNFTIKTDGKIIVFRSF